MLPSVQTSTVVVFVPDIIHAVHDFGGIHCHSLRWKSSQELRPLGLQVIRGRSSFMLERRSTSPLTRLYYVRGFDLWSQPCWSRERSLMIMDLFCERFTSGQISTDSGWHYRVGLGSYTVVGARLEMSMSQSPIHSPHTYSPVGHRLRRPMMSPLPTVAKLPEHSVEELSSDDDSNAATVLLDSDLETRTVIISSQEEDSHEEVIADDIGNFIERPLNSLPSLTPTRTTHASETPSRTAIPNSFSNDSPQSVGCDAYGNYLSNPVSSSETRTRILSSHQSSGSDGQTCPLGDSSSCPVISIYDSLLSLRSHRSGRSELKSVDLATFPHQKLNYLPAKYNGNIVFELPPLSTVKSGGAAMLEGMDQRRDGHAWTETTTTNISDPDEELSFRYVKCLGHLRCENLSCPHLERCGEYNKMY